MIENRAEMIACTFKCHGRSRFRLATAKLSQQRGGYQDNDFSQTNNFRELSGQRSSTPLPNPMDKQQQYQAVTTTNFQPTSFQHCRPTQIKAGEFEEPLSGNTTNKRITGCIKIYQSRVASNARNGKLLMERPSFFKVTSVIRCVQFGRPCLYATDTFNRF